MFGIEFSGKLYFSGIIPTFLLWIVVISIVHAISEKGSTHPTKLYKEDFFPPLLFGGFMLSLAWPAILPVSVLGAGSFFIIKFLIDSITSFIHKGLPETSIFRKKS
jgi:hypothetical protein